MTKNFTLVYVVNTLENNNDRLISKEDFLKKSMEFDEVFKFLDSLEANPKLATLDRIFEYALNSSRD